MSELTQGGFRWKVRHTILSIIWAGWLFSFLDRMVISIALPFIGKDLNIDATMQGGILSAFFAGYALFQIPGGMLADKFGPRKIMSIAIAWFSVFTTLTGFVSSYSIMLFCRLVFGVGEGCFPGASWKMIATYFPPKERATATAIQSSVNTLGPAVASLVAAGIIASYGWRHVFIYLGFPGLLIAALMWYYFRDNPAKHPKITKEELQELNIDQVQGGHDTNSSGITFKTFLTKPILWQMVLIWFLFDITFWGFVSWLPSYLMKVRGFSLIKTGITGSIPFFVGTVGMLVGGYLSDRIKGQRKWMFIPNALIAGFFLYLTYSVASADMVILYQSVSAFFMFLAMSAFWGLVMDTIPPHIMGSSSGTVNFGGQVAGFISPFIMGYLIDANQGSFDEAFIFLIIAIIASAAVAFTVQQERSVSEVKV
ncbi:MFS transporter [Pelosinus propionicus]|uniref:Sugar phosphate permease n=1 Tax=Pelosinus propionicus DSM 13327 TaxID=1123291 RepID=A0A1I4ICK5_9FIRM|nr:MFS transporter [Pelosinus propionicus]SFL51797.1 Sugar phosphate permease [Pelosinus propionicus DSM 13327]